jgi:photosystem II stability/assembly factor-like uncharacterized protein
MKAFLSALICIAFSLSSYGQWQPLPKTIASQLVINAVSEDTLNVAGYSGIFLRSVDGGNSYTEDSLDLFGGWMLDMQFTSNHVGYACGGTAFGQYSSPIVKTTNGGVTWDTLVTNRFGFELSCLHFVSEQLGFFGGAGFMVSTSNGGNTFSVDTVGSTGISDIHFFNALDGIVVGNQTVLRTGDGGQTWDTTLVDTTLSTGWYTGKLQFPNNGSTGFYLNRDNYLFKSNDGGLSWNSMGQITDSLSMVDFQFTSTSVGFACMSHPLFFHNRGFILATTDGGLSWSKVAQSDTGSFTQISMVDDKVGYASTYDRIYKTTNGAALSNVSSTFEFLEVYPNPAHAYVSVNMENERLTSVKLLTVSGELVRTFDPEERKLCIKGISPGTYLLQLEEASGVGSTTKLIIQ